jgi:hypothetical protein
MRTVLAMLVLFTASTALAGWPAGVTVIKTEKGKIATVKGNLKAGKLVDDLSFASRSSVACFPATQNERFRGNHVFFATGIPPQSEMTITVTPKDTSADLSIYAYEVGTNNFTLPPELATCVTCEAEHKWDRPKKGKTQDHTRSVKLNAIKNPYNVVIGVSGPKGATAGDFTLTIDLK